MTLIPPLSKRNGSWARYYSNKTKALAMQLEKVTLQSQFTEQNEANKEIQADVNLNKALHYELYYRCYTGAVTSNQKKKKIEE